MINEEQVLQLYQQKMSGLLIAQTMEVNHCHIYRILKKHGVTRTNKENYAIKFYDRFFQSIDSEEKAYFLGLIAADGMILESRQSSNIMRIDLQEKDYLIIEKLADCLELSRDRIKYYDYTSNYTANGKLVRLAVNSDILVSDLLSHGITPRKSFTLQYPDIEWELQRHFIRGYFDGDGCITSGPTIKICSNENFLLSLQEILMEECKIGRTKLSNRYPERENNIRSLEIGGRKQVKKIYDFLYEGSHVYLLRKYERFQRLLYEN